LQGYGLDSLGLGRQGLGLHGLGLQSQGLVSQGLGLDCQGLGFGLGDKGLDNITAISGL